MRESPLYGALDKLLRPPVLTAFAVLQAALVVPLALAHWMTRTAPPFSSQGSGTGDFDAFWTGAQLIASGRGAQLYDLGAQQELQRAVLRSSDGQWIPYVNPPGLAILLHPLTEWGFLPTHWGFALLQIATLGVALVALRSVLGPALHRGWPYLTLVLLWICFPSVIRSLIGHQNSALTLALLALFFVGTRRGQPIAAGLALGCLSYKPQYALLLGALLVLQRDWRTLGVASALAAAHYAVGAYYCGLRWPLDLLAALSAFRPYAVESMGANQVSLLGASAWMGIPTLGTAAALVLTAWVAWATARTRPQDPRYPAAFATWVLLALLISPHTQHYDVAVAGLPVVLLLDARLSTGRALSLTVRLGIAVAYLSFFSHGAAEALGVQPLVFVLLVLLVGGLSMHRASSA